MNPDWCYEHGSMCETLCKGCICSIVMKEDCESCLELAK